MIQKIIRGLLVSLLQCDGVPMPEDSLIQAADLLCRPHTPTDADVIDVMKTLASQGFISGETDELTKARTWTLTKKGIHKARELR